MILVYQNKDKLGVAPRSCDLCENYEHEFQLTSEWITDKNPTESW